MSIMVVQLFLEVAALTLVEVAQAVVVEVQVELALSSHQMKALNAALLLVRAFLILGIHTVQHMRHIIQQHTSIHPTAQLRSS